MSLTSRFGPILSALLVSLVFNVPGVWADSSQEAKQSSPEDEVSTQRLKLTPAAEPSPALKHRMTADYLQRKPGNAAPFYYRAGLFLKEAEIEEGSSFDVDQFSDWLEQPLDDFPLEEVQKLFEGYPSSYIFEQLEEAASREYCRWDFRLKDMEKKFEAILFPTPELAMSRDLAQLLALKARVQIVQGEYEEALHTLGIGYQFGHDVGRGRQFIQAMVSVATVSAMNDRLLELIEAPQSPNLYWSIAQLPRPLVDLRPVLQYEKSVVWLTFPFLKEAEIAQYSTEEWQRLLIEGMQDLSDVSFETSLFLNQEPIPEWLHWLTRFEIALRVSQNYPAARQRLIEAGDSPEEVDNMSAAQVIAIDEARITRRLFDETFKWAYLPYSQVSDFPQAIENNPLNSPELNPRPRAFPAASVFLSPAGVTRAHFTVTKQRRQLAALQAIEAIRMHAAENDGRLPESLDEITVVPVPLNPLTGKPFPYKRQGKTAVLELPVPHRRERHSHWVQRYQITIESTR